MSNNTEKEVKFLKTYFKRDVFKNNINRLFVFKDI